MKNKPYWEELLDHLLDPSIALPSLLFGAVGGVLFGLILAHCT